MPFKDKEKARLWARLKARKTREENPDQKIKEREYHRKWCQRNRAHLADYYRKNKQKQAARSKVAEAIKSGRLQRKPCEECGVTDRVEAHHEDYNKALDVRWFCIKHHHHLHRLNPNACVHKA